MAERKECKEDYKNRHLEMSEAKCNECEYKYECRFMAEAMDEVIGNENLW